MAFNIATCPGLCCGRRPENFSVPTIGRAFLTAITIESVLMVALAITLLLIHDPTLPTGQIYAGLTIFCTAGLTFFAYDAIFSENRFQLVACLVTSLLFTFFVFWNVFHNAGTLGSAWADLRWEAMGVKVAFQLFYLAAFKRVWDSFGVFEYKVAGADVDIRKLFHRYRAFLTLLKFDFFASVVLFFLVKVYLIGVSDPDFGLGLASLVCSLIFFVVGWWAITHELKPLLWAFLALACLQPAYVGYKAWALEAHPDLMPSNVTVTQFAVLGSLTFLLRLAAVFAAVVCGYGFNKGLKRIVFEGKRAGGGGAAGKRRVIDLTARVRGGPGDVFLAPAVGADAGAGLLGDPAPGSLQHGYGDGAAATYAAPGDEYDGRGGGAHEWR